MTNPQIALYSALGTRSLRAIHGGTNDEVVEPRSVPTGKEQHARIAAAYEKDAAAPPLRLEEKGVGCRRARAVSRRAAEHRPPPPRQRHCQGKKFRRANYRRPIEPHRLGREFVPVPA